jgi:L-ascorbate metabolism protein UlaG (beta-lactamase superfamily)
MDLKGNAVTWLGHGTWLWETSEGKRLLIDAWLQGNPSTPEDLKDPAVLKPDGILITHGHFDHIGQAGSEAVDAIAKTGAPAFAMFEVAAYLGGKGCEVTGFNIGGAVEVAGVTVGGLRS